MSHSGGKTFITVTVFPVSLLACLQTHNQPCFWLIDEVGGGWPHLSSHCCAFCTLQRQRCTGTFGFGNVEYMTRTITHGLGWQLKSKMVWRNTTMVCWWCCGGIICEVWATLDNLLEYVLVFSGIWALASCFPYKYQFLLLLSKDQGVIFPWKGNRSCETTYSSKIVPSPTLSVSAWRLFRLDNFH